MNRTRRTLLKSGLAACGLAAAGGLAWRTARRLPAQYRLAGDTMGTVYNVSFVAPSHDPQLARAAREAVDRALGAVDARMSAFSHASELSALNRHAGRATFPLSAELYEVLKAAESVSLATAGAFDVTAGPLVNAWGFGPRREPRVPARAELARLKAQVGFRLLELDAGSRSVRKLHPDMYTDLSGIAKGYGVDRAVQALDALGIEHYVVEAGGEVRARGRNGRGEPWQVAIEEPTALLRGARRVVPLDGLAMATSGDYRIFFERGGRRYCHEIDPVSGSPVRHRVASVSVMAPTCMQADALATALMVLGPDEGRAFAERSRFAAYFIERTADGGLSDRWTSAFDSLVQRT